MLSSHLKIDNRLSLIGTVCSQPKQTKSPNGIEHCQFLLEHRSEQIEVGLKRQAWCKMPIQLSGNQFTQTTKSITVGKKTIDSRIYKFSPNKKWFNSISFTC